MTIKHEEQYIYDESQEVSVGESPEWATKLASAFPAFQSRNYQLYFYGQLVSLIGTWLQIIAEGWLVTTLTNSPFLIGLVAALATAPTLVLSLFGGVLIDQFPKKTILLCTQSAAMVLALIYGVLTVLNHINIIEICILAFLLGIVNAIDIPARQAFAVELVDDKDQLTSAIALNAGIFNAARVIGPVFAGLLIGLVGTGGAFILNGLSYIAVILALLAMHIKKQEISRTQLHPLQSIKEGIHYSFSHPVIRILLIFTGVVSIFGWSYSTVMPYIARNTFHVGATGFGYLSAANGLGALLATVIVSVYAKKLSPMILIIGGNTIFASGLILFTLTHNLTFALITLFFAGFGLLLQFATINTTIQQMVNDSMRGRVMSIYILMFVGLFPLGNFEIGYLSDRFNPQVAIDIGSVIVFAFGIYLFLQRHAIRKAYMHYKKHE